MKFINKIKRDKNCRRLVSTDLRRSTENYRNAFTLSTRHKFSTFGHGEKILFRTNIKGLLFLIRSCL
jgi:hypothetical protein